MEPTFKHELPLQIRFNDIDALGHVNNSIYFNFYDLGKAGYFQTVRKMPVDWQKSDIVVANLSANFFAPIFFNEEIAVRTTVTEIGNKSFHVFQQIVNTKTKQIKSDCTTIMVGFDLQHNAAKEISDEWKEAICRYEEKDLLRNHIK